MRYVLSRPAMSQETSPVMDPALCPVLRPALRTALRTAMGITLAALALAIATPALTDPVTPDAARAMLFPHDRVEVARYTLDGLSDEERQIIVGIAQEQPFYAAMAFAPDQGILAEPTVFATNYHSRETAHAAALAQCNTLRSGGQPCTLALEVRPAGWEARALQLSADATEEFGAAFSSAPAPRAFAISDQTAAWGTGAGEAATDTALQACAEGGATDCRIVIAD